MTNEQNKLIYKKLCGYEIQISPAGAHYIVTEDHTRLMPDIEKDWAEAMTTFLAVNRSRGWLWRITAGWVESGLFRIHYYGKMSPLQAVAQCLLQIAEAE